MPSGADAVRRESWTRAASSVPVLLAAALALGACGETTGPEACPDPAIPRWAGHAIGFDLVGAFLDANPRRLASDLVDEPAASFIPDAGT